MRISAVRSDRRRAGGAGAAIAVAITLLLTGCTTDVGRADAGALPTGTTTASPSSGPGQPSGPTVSSGLTASSGPTASSALVTEPRPAPTSAGPATAPIPQPSPDPAQPADLPPTAAPEPAPEPEPAPAPAPEVLRMGDDGEAVAQVQRRLVELGYFLPTVDGHYGSSTRQAVWALQKAAGIGRDGLVGPDTRAALDAGARPTPRSTTGLVLEVNLATQLVLVVRDGQIVSIINASSGSGKKYEALGKTLVANTPTGDFTVIRQIDATHDSALGLGEMFRPKYFHGGWAIHGSPSVPPYPASHGCVRVSNDAINWIWDQLGAPVGTPVVFYRG